MIVVEELIFWAMFQCKRAMRVYFLSCIVAIRFGLQKPVRISYVLRFFLTKRQTLTFLKSSFLHAIHYNVVINWF
jgi:hypothetical protein